MADEDTGLPPYIIEKLKKEVDAKQRNMRPAFRNPMLGRAVDKLDKLYPNDMTDVDIDEDPWEHKYSGSNVLGSTDVKPGHHQKVRLNPVISAAFSDDLMENTLAHEVQHVRQNRDRPGDQGAFDQHLIQQMGLPYYDRPDEIDARAASQKYWKDSNQSAPDRYDMVPGVHSYMFPFGRKK